MKMDIDFSEGYSVLALGYPNETTLTGFTDLHPLTLHRLIQ